MNRFSGMTPYRVALGFTLAFACLLVSYQHLALTESGVFGILGLLVGLLLWQPERARMYWLKARGLGPLVAAGYYQRQNVITLAPVVALLHLAGAWGVRQAASAAGGAVAAERRWSTRGAALAQAFVVATLPHLLALPWSPYVDNAGPPRGLSRAVVSG